MVLQPVSEREQEIGNPGQRGLLMLERDTMTVGPSQTDRVSDSVSGGFSLTFDFSACVGLHHQILSVYSHNVLNQNCRI